MWNSPIEKFFGDMHSQIVKQDEENMMYTVRQAMGYSVDKNELLKALQYDREQYKKGYDDAMSVIEDIRAEIQATMEMYEGCEYIGDKARRDELWYVLEIIDKHIKEISDADTHIDA